MRLVPGFTETVDTTGGRLALAGRLWYRYIVTCTPLDSGGEFVACGRDMRHLCNPTLTLRVAGLASSN
jgi:hypothetical protein